MSPATLFVLVATLVLGVVIFLLFFYRRWRRRQTLEQPFPPAWRRLLQQQVPWYPQLSAALQQALERRVQLFLDEKTFYGCDGFEIDDNVRLTIAGHACMLILARSFTHFDDIRSILVYPDVYRASSHEHDGLLVHQSEQFRAGEASSAGQVVLAWSRCAEAVSQPHSAHNVMLHEFAHQLDYLDGSADGAPPLSGPLLHDWPLTMSAAYDDLRHRLQHHRRAWLDPYGATEPAEFFAVLTEAFYQRPHELHSHQPQVYAVLQRYYRFDPLQLTLINA